MKILKLGGFEWGLGMRIQRREGLEKGWEEKVFCGGVKEGG